MLVLDNTDVIEGGGSANSVLDFAIFGMVGSTPTVLADGQLTTTLTTALYTAGAATAIISIIVVNTDSVARTVDLFIDSADAGNPRRLIPKALSLGVGYSMHYDGQRLTVLDTVGRIQSVAIAAAHAVSHVDGSDDIQDATAAQKGLATAAQITKLDGIATNANLYVHPNHSGDVTSAADGAQTIANSAVTLAKMANMATASLLGRNTAGVGAPEVITDIPTAVTIGAKYIYRADGTDVPIADGGTGQSTAQTAINALTAVAGATNEHVLTKDTGTGNAIFKAPAAGGETVKGWIRFNGTGAVSINDSFNTSGLADNGTGLYTISWDTDFANTSYAVVSGDSIDATSNRAVRGLHTLSMAVGSCAINTVTSTGNEDHELISIAAYGDQ